MKKQVQGSFTVEAVFLVPIIIFLTAFIFQTAIALYREVDAASADLKVLEQLDTVEKFKEKE